MLQPTPSNAALQGARCAWHEDRPASIICARCGSYACDSCRNEAADGHEYCADCVTSVSVLAERGTRLAASMIDQILLVLPWVAVIFLEVVLSGVERDGSRAIILVALATLATLGLCVWQLVLVIQNGRSLGKRLMGIRVVRTDGSPADAVRIIVLRNLVPGLINFFCGIFSLVDVLFIFTQQQRCLHDIIADTKVIKVSEHTR